MGQDEPQWVDLIFVSVWLRDKVGWVHYMRKPCYYCYLNRVLLYVVQTGECVNEESKDDS